mgnify:CR=1 FL=1
MTIHGQDYAPIPPNPAGVESGTILLPTRTKLNLVGSSSLDFVLEQGGDTSTFIFLFGLARDMEPLEVIEGIFLNESGPGFRPTWGVEQLVLEIKRGGWKVIEKDEVLVSWAGRVERIMNRART